MNTHRWLAAFAVALLNDIIDIFGLGAIPVGGDILDLATTAILFPLIGGVEPIITVAELVPGADFLPIFTIVTLWAFYRHSRRG